MPKDASKTNFVEHLEKRARQGHEVPIAALIYALVDADRTSRSKPIYGSAIKWIYHRKYASMIFSRPGLLYYVVQRYTKEHRENSWGLSAWQEIASISRHAQDRNYENLKESVKSFIIVLSDSQVGLLAEEEINRIEVTKNIYIFIDAFINGMKEDVILSPECYSMYPKKGDIQKYHEVLTDTVGVLDSLHQKTRAECQSTEEVKTTIIDSVHKLQITPERYIFEALILGKILDIKVVSWKPST